jgi:hypothetical protein
MNYISSILFLRSWVKFGTNVGGTVSGDWANMAQQELCKAKVRKKFAD